MGSCKSEHKSHLICSKIQVFVDCDIFSSKTSLCSCLFMIWHVQSCSNLLLMNSHSSHSSPPLPVQTSFPSLQKVQWLRTSLWTCSMSLDLFFKNYMTYFTSLITNISRDMFIISAQRTSGLFCSLCFCPSCRLKPCLVIHAQVP